MKVSVRWHLTRNQKLLRRQGQHIKVSLKVGRQHHVGTSREDIETSLAVHPPTVKEACHRMKGWYKEANDHAPPPK